MDKSLFVIMCDLTYQSAASRAKHRHKVTQIDLNTSAVRTDWKGDRLQGSAQGSDSRTVCDDAISQLLEHYVLDSFPISLRDMQQSHRDTVKRMIYDIFEGEWVDISELTAAGHRCVNTFFTYLSTFFRTPKLNPMLWSGYNSNSKGRAANFSTGPVEALVSI